MPTSSGGRQASATTRAQAASEREKAADPHGERPLASRWGLLGETAYATSRLCARGPAAPTQPGSLACRRPSSTTPGHAGTRASPLCPDAAPPRPQRVARALATRAPSGSRPAGGSPSMSTCSWPIHPSASALWKEPPPPSHHDLAGTVRNKRHGTTSAPPKSAAA
jgi:hypothetical protein